MSDPMGKDVSDEAARQEILDAAMACFTELGYDGTTIDAIAARPGLAGSTVRRHFAGKVEIRDALVALWSERLSGWMTSA
jgi:AcrR family transcriptional regulator